MSNLLELLKTEQKRVAELLPTLTPGTEEYSRALDLLRVLRWEIAEIATPITEAVVPPPVLIPAPAEDSSGAAYTGPATAEEKSDTPEIDWAKYRTTLRGELTAARNNGINITELIQSMGCGSYSGVPDEKLPELRELLEKAQKENG